MYFILYVDIILYLCVLHSDSARSVKCVCVYGPYYINSVAERLPMLSGYYNSITIYS